MIFQREWKRNLKSLIIWSLVLAGLIIWLLSIFPQFAKEQANMQQLLKAYPESMRNAFGMNQLDFGTLIGFYGVEIHMMTTLLGSIYAALLGSNIVAKEESEKTIEFLLSKPVSRTSIILQKYLAVIMNVFLINAISVLASVIGFQFGESPNIPWNTYFLLALGTFLLHLTFASLSFLLSSIMRKTKNTLSISLGIVLVTYFFNIMAGISKNLENLKYVSPFKYVDAATIVPDKALDPLYVGIMIFVIIISIAFSFMIYRRKDITV
ncbi:ABC transporter permease subunit [Bacillus sp. 03113]|uniref:ABC transporter permease subunit n=1 Tax=Bacillus sp. 03113 TaxID=2578211 RepID=UPI00114266E7|nr:ABC transporter permease subunit [Bacillus sp. 03113]